MFTLHQLYRRKEIHDQYGGQRQGGISTPSEHSVVFIITGASGKSHGYHDTWSEDGVLDYYGEGQYGDMKLDRGNAAILNHAARGKDLHLFEAQGHGLVRYLGQVVCVGYEERTDKDSAGEDRRAYVFQLAALESANESASEPSDERTNLSAMWTMGMEKLKEIAAAQPSANTTPKQAVVQVRKRSQAVRVYVLRRANGQCEACNGPAPFKRPNGTPYLEPHHIKRLSDGGPDDPRWVAGVCPNCHRRAHYADDHSAFNQQLLQAIEEKEAKQ
jgi:5-methylcytosine-specific restriction protein A